MKTLFDGLTGRGWMLCDRKPLPRANIQADGLNPHGTGSFMVVHDQPLGDFVLDFDYKLTKDCNSGVLLRVSDLKDPINTGIEVSLDDVARNDDRDSGGFNGLVEPTEFAQKPAGLWNHMTITALGPRIAVVLNERDVAQINLDDWTVPGQRPDGSAHRFKGVALAKLAQRIHRFSRPTRRLLVPKYRHEKPSSRRVFVGALLDRGERRGRARDSSRCASGAVCGGRPIPGACRILRRGNLCVAGWENDHDRLERNGADLGHGDRPRAPTVQTSGKLAADRSASRWSSRGDRLRRWIRPALESRDRPGDSQARQARRSRVGCRRLAGRSFRRVGRRGPDAAAAGYRRWNGDPAARGAVVRCLGRGVFAGRPAALFGQCRRDPPPLGHDSKRLTPGAARSHRPDMVRGVFA